MEIDHLNILLDRALSSKGFCFPDSIVELIGVIGIADTYKITRTYGGTRVYIPKTLPPSKCTLAISPAGITALQRDYGGESIEIPKSASIDRFVRNISIFKMLEEGRSIRDIARHYDLSVRQINNIRANNRLYSLSRKPPLKESRGG